MGTPFTKEVVEKVINESVDGGFPMSYYVQFTAERVMLLFGDSPKSHRDALRILIKEQTNGEWENDQELAERMEAKMAIGLPSALEKLRIRLENMMSQGAQATA